MLTFMVALQCEAKPLIDLFKLKKVFSKPFDFYCSEQADGNTIELVVSGIGALAMSCAVGWVGGQPLPTNRKAGVSQRVWLNIGTAGHASRSLGDVVLVHGAGDEVQQRCHYPSLVAKWAGQTEAVLSVSAPSNVYPGGAAVDMEAFAFFNAALRLSDSELVQSLKVISDNETSGVEGLNAQKLTDFIAMNMNSITSFSSSLAELASTVFADRYKNQLELPPLSHLRGTHSQRLQVQDLIVKLRALSSQKTFNVDALSIEIKASSDLKAVTQLLRVQLNAITPSLAG